jgi:5-methylcytosine-specific restriction endonuclease McrA
LTAEEFERLLEPARLEQLRHVLCNAFPEHVYIVDDALNTVGQHALAPAVGNMSAPNRSSVLKAMKDYKGGEQAFLDRHSGGRSPRTHYLLHEGTSYPLKALWAAAHLPAIHARNFKTGEALAGFRSLGFKRFVRPTSRAQIEKGLVSGKTGANGTGLSKRATTLEELEKRLEVDVRRSLSDSVSARRKRLARADNKPTRISATTTVFARNADVIAEVLDRSEGNCEGCGKPAPFDRRNRQPYLEVHHRKMLSRGGLDTAENALALCPNCHRYRHFGYGPMRY